jgi:hypothetical protein
MKKLAGALLLMSTVFTLNVSACEKYEAQIIAEVVEIETDSNTYCRAIISEESIEHFQEHFFCPLDKSEIIEKGISFPLQNGHDCVIPDRIGGYAYGEDGKIKLE